MNQQDYTIRIAVASLLVIAMALPIGVFTLQESTRLDSQATSRQTPNPSTRLPGELLVTPALTQQKSGFNNCRIGGCNGELCADPATGLLDSICVYKKEFACYRNAVCELQSDGQCGWILTDQLRQCLGETPGTDNQPPAPPPVESQLPSTGTTTQPSQVSCDLACPNTFILTTDCQCLPPKPSPLTVNANAIVPPVLHPSTLPSAITQQYYLTQIELTSPLEHSRLEVSVSGLPTGLVLEDCTPTINSFNRRLSTCTLSGMVDSPARTYRLVFTVGDGLGNTAIETRDLQIISQKSWLDRLFSRFHPLSL